jgi:hypothetical protein
MEEVERKSQILRFYVPVFPVILFSFRVLLETLIFYPFFLSILWYDKMIHFLFYPSFSRWKMEEENS